MPLLGIYSPRSCTIHERCSFEEFHQAIEYFVNTKHDDLSFLTDDEINFYSNCFSTGIHELTHFCQCMSTPFGLFQVRCSMTKAALLQSIFLNLKESKWVSNGGNIYVPLHEWNKIVKGIDEELSHIMDEKLEYIKNIEDLEDVFFFNGHFNCRNDEINLSTTMRLGALGFNSYFGLEPLIDLPRFKHKQIPHSKMIQDRKITSIKILESYAKFLEDDTLFTLKLPFSGPYDVKYYLIALQSIKDLYPGADADTMLAILDYSLFTIADPLFHELWDSEMYFEDLIPVCRMFQLIEKARENKLKVKNLKFLDFYEKMADLLKWPSPGLILKTMCDFNFQPTPVPTGIGGARTKRSIIESLLFEYFNKMSQIRLNSSFVDDPFFHLKEYDPHIRPLLRMGDQDLQIPQHLTHDEGLALMRDLIRYELVEDLLNFDNFQNTDKLVKTISSKLDSCPQDFYNHIFPGFYFIPFEKIKPLSEMFI